MPARATPGQAKAPAWHAMAAVAEGWHPRWQHMGQPGEVRPCGGWGVASPQGGDGLAARERGARWLGRGCMVTGALHGKPCAPCGLQRVLGNMLR